MDKVKRKVVLSQLGTQLDSAEGPNRFASLRPTYSLFHHDDLLIERLELLVPKGGGKLAEELVMDIRAASPETEVRQHDFTVNDPWDFESVFAAFHQFATEYSFETDNEEYLMHITTGTHVSQICMFLLTESGHYPAKLIQTAPGRKRDWQGRFTIIDLDLSQYDEIANRFLAEQDTRVSFLKAGIATRNTAFNHMIAEIEQVALRSDSPILLQGPTGAGKTQLARRIYELKRRERQVEGEFVEVNCATIRGDQAMSLLFGHRVGAFTGAISDRDGLLVRANGGLLFLDEIGELGLDEQAMILRAVEEGRFLPVGSDREVESRFQVIAGTNRDLPQRVREGRFREDLLARLQLWSFDLPGLSERKEDIEPNLDFELADFHERSGQQVVFNREAREQFLEFAHRPGSVWTGNFRDLGAAVTRMATLASGKRITTDDVSLESKRLAKQWSSVSSAEPASEELHILFSEDQLAEIDHFDRPQLAYVVRICRQSKSVSEAGRALFQASRERRQSKNDADRLRKYLTKFGLSWEKVTNR